MKPRILAIVPGIIPSTIINVITPIMDLHFAGQIDARVALEPYIKEKDLKWCDLVVLCRNTDPDIGRWFLNFLHYNKPYIYDIDDNFFELPPDTPIGKYHTAPERINFHTQYIRWADLVRVYSKPMFEKAKSMNTNVVQVAGSVDWRLLAPRQELEYRDIVKLVYATSRVKDTLSDLIKPALHSILKKYRNQIEVYFLGYNPPEFKAYMNVYFKPLTLNYQQYLRYFSGAGFDIGLAPLLNDAFHRSKTNLKVREYGACHIAGIYSDVDVYSSTVIQGETGILVENNDQAWFNAMATLIENRDLRISIQENAYQFALKNFSHIAFNQLWYQQISLILEQPRKKEDQKSVLHLYHIDRSQSSDPHGAFYKLLLVPHSIWLYKLLREKTKNIISGIKSDGIEYIVRTVRFYIETYGMLIKIKIKLFFFKTNG